MAFGKSFSILGVIFGLFIFATMAFPQGVVESTANGTVNMPRVETIGDLNTTVIFFLLIALVMLGTVLFAAAIMTLIRLRNLKEVASAYGADLSALNGFTPMQAANMLTDREQTRIEIIKSINNNSSVRKSGKQIRLKYRHNRPGFHWI